MLKDISVSFSPHISKPLSTRAVMVDVIIGLAPAMLAAGYYFRLRAVILIAACVIASMVTEFLCNTIRRKPCSLSDFSAVVTGIILALSLPPKLPVWTAVIGCGVGVAIGKMVFGGLGSNIFNPAMVGRTFLAVSFGTLMTTWTVPATVDPNMSVVSAENMLIEGPSEWRTQATPLAWSKKAIKDKNGAETYAGDEFFGTFTGEVGGCLGETSALALLLGGAYLFLRKTISVHIPAAVLLSALVFGTIAYMSDSMAYVQPLYHLTSGGMLLCALFIATDPVTAPLTRRGMWVFGIGVGALTMLIRIVGGYPEGVMFAILIMNAVTPLIDRLCRRVPAGGKPQS